MTAVENTTEILFQTVGVGFALSETPNLTALREWLGVDDDERPPAMLSLWFDGKLFLRIPVYMCFYGNGTVGRYRISPGILAHESVRMLFEPFLSPVHIFFQVQFVPGPTPPGQNLVWRRLEKAEGLGRHASR